MKRPGSSNERLAEAQAIAHLGSWEWDIPANRVEWSDEMYRIHGYAPQQFEITFEKALELVVPDDARRIAADVQRIFAEARAAFRAGRTDPYFAESGEYRITRPDGEPRVLQGQGRLMLDAAGEPARMVGTVLDVTERTRVLEALTQSETRLRTIIESEPECVKLLSRDGRLLDMNPAGLRMIEADSLDQVKGQPVLPIVAPEHREAFSALHRRVFAGESGTLEFEIVGLRGTRRWLETHAVPLRGPSGEVETLLGITRDVTERRRGELERRRSEEVLRKRRAQLRALSHRLLDVQEQERRYIARELHDQIGQALTAIKLNLQSIGAAGRGATVRRALREAVLLVDTTIQQVRTLSFDLRPPMLDDLGLAAALGSYARRQANGAGLDLVLTIDPTLDGITKDVETACFRIAQEAITNVVRHARARRLNVAVQRANGTLELLVEDDGKGMASVVEDEVLGSGPGILGMRERAEAAGGVLELGGGSRGGTVVRARFPALAPHA